MIRKTYLFSLFFAFVSIALQAQTINPSQSDKITTDNKSQNKANPGDRIRYQVTISETGAATDATGVQLNAVPDANTTFVAGSFRSSPLAFPDAYTCTGNVPISVPAVSGLLANDFDDNIAGLSCTAETVASVNGGSATISADGSFTYTPPAGFTGTDTFNYTLEDGNPVGAPIPATDGGTATITVSNMIWFLDNATAAATNDGRLNTPFKTLASFETVNGGAAATNPKAGQVIFLHTGNGDYTGGITLENNQRLFGQGTTGTNLANVLPFTAAPNSAALPTIGGTNPVLRNTGGTAVTLASGNDLRGFDIGKSASFQSGGGIAGAAAGDLKIDALSAFVNGGNAHKGVDINGCVMIDMQMVQLNLMSCSPIALDLGNIGGGTWDVSGATSISNASGKGVEITNSGGTTFTFSDLDIDNSSSNGIGIFASTAGTLNTTSGTFNTGSGTAVDIDNTALGMTLTSVSSSGGSTPGIDLNTTTGSFTVTGDGVNAAKGGNGSGGTISGKSSSGILLSNVTNISLQRMNIINNSTHGLDVNTINGFTLANVTVEDNGNAVAEQGVRIRELTGAFSVTDGEFNRNAEDQIEIVNTGGTMTSFNVAGNDFSHAFGAGAPANNGINMRLSSNSLLNSGLVQGNTFMNLFATGIQVDAEGSADIGVGSGNKFVINNNNFTNNNIAINLTNNHTADFDFDITNNLDINGHAGNVINIFSAPSSTGGTFRGTLSGNTIGTGGGDSGSTLGSGIRVLIEGDKDAAMLINGNTIREIKFGRGIECTARNAPTGVGELDVTITNNVARANTSTGLAGILVLADNVSAASTLRADISGNTAVGGPFFFGFGGDFTLNETAGSTLQLVGTAANCETQIGNTNTALTPAINNSPASSCAIIVGPINVP